jgi:hypothetical protein
VRAKISEIETCYRRANDWINNTGAGVDCQETLQNYVKKLCPYYYDVHEVFMDRASSFAAYTSERNFDDSSEVAMNQEQTWEVPEQKLTLWKVLEQKLAVILESHQAHLVAE